MEQEKKMSQMLQDRVDHIRQTAKDIRDSVNDTITAIGISYAGKMISLKPTTPELAKVYDAALAGLANSVDAEADVIEKTIPAEIKKENAETARLEKIRKEQEASEINQLREENERLKAEAQSREEADQDKEK